MEDCVFCKIRDGEIPSPKLHEDEHCYAVNDINPKAKTHILIIPNKHIHSIAKMEKGDETLIGHMVKIARDLAAERELRGYKLVFNVEKHGGQEIFHIHMHLLSD
ncbi:MAG: HIT domain-containing protein [Patescibacteria group bacterium]|nr:HIT domain-containing protein [Patescibacteria group bacterium]